MLNIDTGTFIKEIMNRPPIWCSTNAPYKNKNVIKKKWDELLEVFPGSKVTDLKKKWKNLRDHYRKELKRCLANQSGDIDGDRYKSSWKYFNNMSFTKGELMPILCEVSVNQEEQDSEDDNSASAEDEFTETSVECKEEPNTGQIVNERKRPVQDLRQEYLEIEKKKLKLLENDSTCPRTNEDFIKSQDYHFLMSLLPEIEKLPLLNKFRLRNRFNDVLLEEINSIIINPH